MEKIILLVLILISVILICSCLFSIKMKRVIEKYRTCIESHHSLHYDTLQYDAIDKLKSDIQSTDAIINNIKNETALQKTQMAALRKQNNDAKDSITTLENILKNQ